MKKDDIEALTNADIILTAICARFVKRLDEQVGIIEAIRHGENPSIALDTETIKEVESQLSHFKDFPLYFLTAVFQAVADVVEANNRILLEIFENKSES